MEPPALEDANSEDGGSNSEDEDGALGSSVDVDMSAVGRVHILSDSF